MSTKYKYTIKNDRITIVVGGKLKHVKEQDPNFAGLRNALLNKDWEGVKAHLTPKRSIEAWAKGKFKVKGDNIYYDGEKLPTDIHDRVMAMVRANEDPTSLFNFWSRLKKNPSKRAVDCLYKFLTNNGISITKEGCFLAYKGVRGDYTDDHSGKFSNKPGTVLKVDRNMVSDDPRADCAEGFHVGSRSFASGYGTVLLVTLCDPEHVVSVPYSDSASKIRMCQYKSLGRDGGQLSNTTFEEDVSAYGGEDDEEVIEDVRDKDSPRVPVAKKVKNRKSTPKSHKFDKLTPGKLMEESIADLRAYALHLKIVGASKIPGGKTALVGKIVKMR